MMLITHVILAVAAVGALALRPQSTRAVLVLALAAVIDALLGAPAVSALAVILPLVAFLAAALTLASLVERSGLAERAACALAAAAHGSSLTLYTLVCGVCALATAAVSLDGAVVLMIPLLVILAQRFDAPFTPLFLGAVAVANAASIAVPQGNPTNLVIINRLGVSTATFLEHMLVPGIAAAAICAAGIALSERRALASRLRTTTRLRTPLSPSERHPAISLTLAALTAWTAPIFGIAPWWPFTAAVAIALAVRRERPRLTIPWRIAVQVGGLLIVTQALGLTVRASAVGGLPELLAIAASIGAASAIANNLPVSVCATGLLTAGAPAYAASVGLAVGSLATPQGSVATLIASQLAGATAPPLKVRLFAPLAALGVLTATLVLWANP
jgi:Na+/H+ antiporter NhaD/arsenite permease-like protein